MQCPRCQQENPAHARFCLGCGAGLALACSACGTELPGGARFCLQCGQAVVAGSAAAPPSPAPETYTPKHLAEKILTSKAALEGERKQVTVLFADLKGSMELLADRDPEEARKLLDPVMDRRRFLLTSLAGVLAGPLVAGAQQAGKVWRIGYLSAAGPAPFNANAFKDALRELGYVEGKNLVIDYRFAEGRYERLPDLAAELVRLKADIIVTNPTPAAMAAKNATGTIPIVMISGSVDPVGLGLVASLARPGGNVTGLSYGTSAEIFSKGLELLKEIVPKVRRVAVLSNPGSPIQPLIIRELNVAGRSLGVQLQLLEVRGPDEFDGAFAAMAKEGVGALLVVSDSLFNLHRTRLADLAARSRLPAAYGTRDLVEVGGLMSYGPSFRDLHRRGAVYVDKILRGAKPADLPVEQPTKFELVINLKTAKALGLTIPPSLLARADQVIE